jgi:hypothetical protein
MEGMLLQTLKDSAASHQENERVGGIISWRLSGK